MKRNNVCSDIQDYTAPNFREYMSDKIEVIGFEKARPYSHLLRILIDVGLIGDMANTSRQYFKGDKILTYYGSEYAIVHFKEDIKIRGLMLTEIGTRIASLYSQKETDLGKRIFRDWLSSLDENTAEVRDISEQEMKELGLVK